MSSTRPEIQHCHDHKVKYLKQVLYLGEGEEKQLAMRVIQSRKRKFGMIRGRRIRQPSLVSVEGRPEAAVVRDVLAESLLPADVVRLDVKAGVLVLDAGGLVVEFDQGLIVPPHSHVAVGVEFSALKSIISR